MKQLSPIATAVLHKLLRTFGRNLERNLSRGPPCPVHTGCHSHPKRHL